MSMFAILCRRRLWFRPKDTIFSAQPYLIGQDAFSVRSRPFSVCENDSENTFTFSYLVNSCGLSSEDAASVSNKLRFKSPEKPDAVLELLRKYGFTDAYIARIVVAFPNVLSACPNKTLLPKLDFFQSIGVPLPVLAQKLSVQPSILMRSLENYITPSYNTLKDLLQSDEKVVHAFSRSPCIFGRCGSKGISSNISLLRERGMPDSSIVNLVMHQPSLLALAEERLAEYVDRAIVMGFDLSRSSFIHAIQVFAGATEATLTHKMDVYKRCGWSESDINAAFLRHPFCMNLSEEKIIAHMEFLVDKVGYELSAIVACPMLLGYSLDKRIKPRCLVARILNGKGLKVTGVTSMLKMSEDRFLKRFIVKYEEDIPELLEIYLGKTSPPPEVDFN